MSDGSAQRLREYARRLRVGDPINPDKLAELLSTVAKELERWEKKALVLAEVGAHYHNERSEIAKDAVRWHDERDAALAALVAKPERTP